MDRRVNVLGVGMTKFAKPRETEPYFDMAANAARAALKDAGVDYAEVQQAYTGYVFGDSCCGQRAMYDVGMTGIPVINVHNNCATGSTALYLARQAVASGVVECALAVGFEQMTPGAIGSAWQDRPDPMENFINATIAAVGTETPPAPGMFAGAARQYMERTGAKPETFGKITEKARRHAAKNPNAVFRDLLTLEEIMASPMIADPITRFQCCPPTCGAAAAVVCSDDFAKKHGVTDSVYIAGQVLTTDGAGTFDDGNLIKMVAYDMTAEGAARLYEETGIGPQDVDLVELHDCFTVNEVLTYEALGLVEDGGAEKMVEDGDNTYGGKYVVNPSGGLLAKGHPLGATGLAQCAELVWHLRGQAGERQVEGARVALQHNVGLGGAAVVTMYRAV